MAHVARWGREEARAFEALVRLCARDSERHGKVFARRIMNVVRRIQEDPQGGRVVPEFGNPNLRERVAEDHRIVYRLTPDAIEIVAICHGKRPLGSILHLH